MKKISLKTILTILLYCVIGVGIGLLLGREVGAEMVKTGLVPGLILIFAGVILGFLLGIIIHEAGHMIFGLLSGYRLSSFRIGSFVLLKEDDKFTIKRFSIPGTAGQCLMVPPAIKDDKIPVLWYNLGGGIFNLLTVIICILLCTFCIESPYVRIVLKAVIIISLVLGLTNLIPIKTEQIANDGYNAFSLGKNKKAMKAFYAQLIINDYQTRGKSLSEIPSEWLQPVSDEDMNDPIVATIGVFYANLLMEQERFDEMIDTIKHYFSIPNKIMGLYISLLKCDMAYCLIIKGASKDEIDSILTDDVKAFMHSMKKLPQIIRTNYVYELFCNNNKAEADRLMETFNKVIKTNPYKSDVVNETRFIEIANEAYRISNTL